MFDSGLVRQFITFYRKRHFAYNPSHLEEWLRLASPETVIIKAFSLKTNETFGFDYWKDIQDKWCDYWELHKSNYSNLGYIYLRSTFAILRQNWNNEKYWEIESRHDTYKRMGMTPPEDFTELEQLDEKDAKVKKVKSEPIQPIQDEPIENKPIEEEPKEEAPLNPLDDFEFIDVSKDSYSKLASDKVSLIYKERSYRLTFNRILSNYLRTQHMPYARIAKSKSGDICIILNRVDGIKMVYPTRSKDNITINSKVFTEKLRSLFKITNDYTLLTITHLQTTPDYLIYKLSL